MLPLRNITIDQAVREAVEKYSPRPALAFGGRHWTYAEFDAEVDRIARLLLGIGVRKGTHVGILCEAEPNAIFSMFALSRIGAVTILFNTSLRRTELRDLMDHTDVEYLLIGDGYKDIDYRQECFGFVGGLSVLQEIFSIGLSGQAAGYRTLEELVPEMAGEDALARAVSLVRPKDDAFMLFTSGTMSRPKAVVTTHYSRVNSGLQQGRDQALTEEDRLCVAMPAF
ncbi:MAG: AMP-binding protein, partial [Clostridia bacterium]|nr:AMP-binding protein [Clostridia bacterium]